jgi:hypothetical protein
MPGVVAGPLLTAVIYGLACAVLAVCDLVLWQRALRAPVGTPRRSEQLTAAVLLLAAVVVCFGVGVTNTLGSMGGAK